MANEIWDPAYIDWLMNTPQFEDDVSYDEDILADQGKRLTQASKYGNLVTDLDYQLATGGLQPGAFEPLVSYESVETPGRKRLNQWMGGSPYQKYVAEWLGSGRSANELLSDLTKMVAQPTGDPLENDIIGDRAVQVHRPAQHGCCRGGTAVVRDRSAERPRAHHRS
jgi:hypothetical protein